MAITQTDLQFRLSTKSGTKGNSVTSSGSASLGKYVSTSSITPVNYDLFTKINGGEARKGDTEYRCVFVINNHATLTLCSAKVFLVSEIDPGAFVYLAADPTAASLKASTAAQAVSIASDTVAPSGVASFVAVYTKGTGVSLGNIGPGEVKAFWAKRVIDDVGGFTDGATFAVAGNSQP